MLVSVLICCGASWGTRQRQAAWNSVTHPDHPSVDRFVRCAEVNNPVRFPMASFAGVNVAGALQRNVGVAALDYFATVAQSAGKRTVSIWAGLIDALPSWGLRLLSL
jgi:hypothetical protein